MNTLVKGALDIPFVRFRLNGELHREGSPAVEYANGNKEWWLNGIRYSEERVVQ